MKHLIWEDSGLANKAICGLRTRPDDLVDEPALVTCKRCLKELEPEEPVVETPKKKVKVVLPRGLGKGEARGKVNPPVAAKAEPAEKEFPTCLCGCDEKTRGGKFRPGHDARYYATHNHDGSPKPPKTMPDCACGCGEKTRGGKWMPGHDAKHYSKMLKLEREAAKAVAA